MNVGVEFAPVASTHKLRRMRPGKHNTGLLKWIMPILAPFLLTDIAWAEDPDLSSWNDLVARKEVVQLIARIEDTSNPAYLPPQDRVAVFDIDGTLWPERPTSIAGAFYIDRIKDHFHKFRNRDISKHGDDTHSSNGREVPKDGSIDVDSMEGYKRDVRDWLSTALHPSLKVQYSN
jgi:hypothetical protein